MKIKGITDEDFVNYKIPSMYIAMATCDFKCDRECGMQVCQNSGLAKQPTISVFISDLVERYIRNDITGAIVFGGLEPFDQFSSLWLFILTVRVIYEIKDDIVIYTGYTKEELDSWFPEKNDMSVLERLKTFENIVVKFGRYIPGQKPHYDEVLGVHLASDNQYAERIS